MAKSKAAKKGVAGKKTGPAARKAINTKLKQGLTMDEIGKAAKRDGSTISAIHRGIVKNPPKNLAGNVRKAKAKNKKK